MCRNDRRCPGEAKKAADPAWRDARNARRRAARAAKRAVGTPAVPTPQGIVEDIARWSLVVDRNDDMVARIQKHVEENQEPAPPLYRGVPLNEHTTYLTLDMLKPGAPIDIPVSSFSESERVAEEFAFDQNDEDAPSIMFVLVGGSGVPISKHSQIPDQDEWLTCGSFRIESVTSNPERELDYVVHLVAAPASKG